MKQNWFEWLKAEASKLFHNKGYAYEHKAFIKGGQAVVRELIQELLEEEDTIEDLRNKLKAKSNKSFLIISIPQFKIKGAFMSVTKKRSELKDSGDGVKFITGSLKPETDAGTVEKVKDGSVTATSDSDGVTVSVDPTDQSKWKATVDETKFPFKATLTFTANADLVDGGTVDSITGTVELDFVEDEATQLVVEVD